MRGPFAALTVSLLVLCGCRGAASSPSTPTGQSRPATAAGQPLVTSQRTLTGKVRGSIGGYTSLIKATSAQRSVDQGRTGTLIRLEGIGGLRVACSARPRSSFHLTAWAAGEGPPTVFKESTHVSHRTSLFDTDGIPPSEAHAQVLDHWEIDGGGEAFQFEAEIVALLTPTATRCDLLADATVVTHGPFYRYAPG